VEPAKARDEAFGFSWHGLCGGAQGGLAQCNPPIGLERTADYAFG
jgi:hypothetical protein